jgi:1-acyl-sn-glycerol-3-phosphate acyltransferase
MHDRILASLRVAGLILLTLGLLGPALLAAALTGKVPRALARLWHGGCCRLAGLSLQTHGAPVAGRPVLFVANHVSYLDIVLLGSVLDAGFIAKAEVRGWPGIGLIARLGRTLFVARRMAGTGRERDAIARRLAAGESLILFAEGTSSDGRRVLPFKSALFGALDGLGPDTAVVVQPVTLAYLRFRGGLAIGHGQRAAYAWYGAMDLLPHLWQMLGLPGAEVELRFHPPVRAADFASRKLLAQHAEGVVAAGLAALRQAA